MQHTTPDGSLTIWGNASGYHIKHNLTGRVEPVPTADIDTLFIHPDMFEDGASSVRMTDNAEWLRPGTPIFNQRLAQDIDSRPSDYYQHYFGMMRGMGLKHMVSIAELDAIFD